MQHTVSVSLSAEAESEGHRGRGFGLHGGVYLHHNIAALVIKRHIHDTRSLLARAPHSSASLAAPGGLGLLLITILT